MKKHRFNPIAALVFLLLSAAVIGLTAWMTADSHADSVPVLLYHHVSTTPEEYDPILVVTPEKLYADLRGLLDAGYTSISLDEYARYREKGEPLPEKAFLITFDDGYMSNYTYAFPILLELEVYAVIFMVESFLTHPAFMDEAHLLEMEQSGFVAVQSHGREHLPHGTLALDDAALQMSASAHRFNELMPHEFMTISWPENSYSADLVSKTAAQGVSLQFVQSLNRVTPSYYRYLALRRSVPMDRPALEIAESFY